MTTELTLIRKAKLATYTIGKLYAGSEWLCDTIEDTDRGLSKDMPLDAIKAKKIYGKTAIPTGRYKLSYTYSPKYKKMLPLLGGVPAWEGVRIHSGNTAEDSLGCIIVGLNKKKGMVLESRMTMAKLLVRLLTWWKQGEIYITIQ